MTLSYTRMEEGKIVCNKIYDDKQIEQAKQVLIDLFNQNYQDQNVVFTVDDDILLDFMVMCDEHKDDKEMVKHWLADTLEFEVTISLTENVTEELIKNLPDLDLESKPEELKEQLMENTQEKKIDSSVITAAEEMKKWVIGSMPINMKKREEPEPNQTTTGAAPVPVKENQPPEMTINVFAEEKSFDWANAGKTVGVFLGGAAAGVAGKWVWDKVFG